METYFVGQLFIALDDQREANPNSIFCFAATRKYATKCCDIVYIWLLIEHNLQINVEKCPLHYQFSLLDINK